MTEYLRKNLEDVALPPGQGRISGGLSVALGLLGSLGALCFLFPDVLTTPQFRPLYNAGILHHVLYGAILLSFGFGFYSVMRGNNRRLGLTGLALATLASVLGSMQPEHSTALHRSLYAGLDYFVLTLLILALVFVPLERLFPKDEEQKTLRRGWTTDLKYFFMSHVGIQLISFFSVIPAQRFFTWLIDARFQHVIAAQPVWAQFIEILFAVDFFSYWLHRFMHEVPSLWKIHAVHHSTEHMDWLASARVHVLEMLANRLLGYLPIFVLGFSPGAVYAYLVFISFHAIFIHANVRFRFPGLRWVLATPEFHHWHHTSQTEGVDKNYAAFLPVYDVVFRTTYLPEHLPQLYSTRGKKLPEGFVGQFLYPFRQWLEAWQSRS
jgi:sterol desaturase/sphingolipid hydroxylase (fatty acid hydroxylase superfamily)